jgi:transposase
MIYVGIDVAKNKHDCCILGSNGKVVSTFTFDNNKGGYEKLIATIAKFSKSKSYVDVKIGLESTGCYSLNLTNYLNQKRLSVKVFNPLLVNLRRKAESLRKTKTDKSDCKFLASMLFSEESEPYLQPVLPISELKILTRNRSRLIHMRTKLKQSIARLVDILFPELPSLVYSLHQKSSYALLLEYPTAKSIASTHIVKLTNLLSCNSKGKYGRARALQVRELANNSIGFDSVATGFELKQTIRLIQNLDGEIAMLDDQIKTIMDELNSPILSIPGIGYTLGAIILSEIGDIRNFSNPAKLLKFAGLEPSVYESGRYKASDTPMVKRGSAYLRWALLQAARLIAMRDSSFRAYQAKKRAEGKHFFVVQSHLAKKLVRVLHKMLSTGAVFDAKALQQVAA